VVPGEDPTSPSSSDEGFQFELRSITTTRCDWGIVNNTVYYSGGHVLEMEAVEVVRPLLQRALAIIKSHIRDVEFAVLGLVSPDGQSLGGTSGENVPPKKHQPQICASICLKWGEFPLGEPELQKIIANWAMLPEDLRTPALLELITKAQEEVLDDELAISNLNSELVQATLDLFVAEWVDACLLRVTSPDLAAAIEERALLQPQLPSAMQQQPSSTSIMTKLLSRRPDSSQPSTAWWWSGLIVRLRASSSLKWTEILRRLPGPLADDFILNRLTALGTSAGGSSGAALIAWCAQELVPKDLASSHLPALLLQSYANAEDDLTREVVLQGLKAAIERADLVSTPDAARIATKAVVLAESAIKSRETKDEALKLTAALLAKTLGDNVELMIEKFISKRIIRAFASTDTKKVSRAVDLATIMLKNSLGTVAQKKLAALFSAEMFEKVKASKVLRSGGWGLEDYQYTRLVHLICLADPFTGVQKTLPSLFASGDEHDMRKVIVGVTALRLVLSDPSLDQIETVHAEKLLEFVEKIVLPHLITLASASAAPPFTYDWASFTEVQNSKRNSLASAQFFGSLVAQPNQAELKAKLYLKQQRQDEAENAFSEADRLIRSFAQQPSASSGEGSSGPSGSPSSSEISIDPSTETRVMCIIQGIECVRVARGLAVAMKGARMVRLPPVQFLDRHAHHPAVRQACLQALRRIAASSSFMEKVSVIKALRGQVADTMDLVPELVSCVRAGHPVHPRPPPVDIVRDLGTSLDALALTLAVAGLDGAEELAQSAEWAGLSANHVADAMRRQRNIARLVFDMPLMVQQEVMRLITGWSSMQKKPRDVAWALSTRGTSVFVACDPSKANLEDACWSANLKRPSIAVTGNSSSGSYASFTDLSLLLDVVSTAEYQETSVVAVLSRVLQWWRTTSQASAAAQAHNSPSTTSFSTSKKSFSVLRRLTASAGQQANSTALIASSFMGGSLGAPPSSSSAPGNSNASQISSSLSSTSSSEEIGSAEEDEVLVRVIRRVVESRVAIENSLRLNGTRDSMVLKLLKDVLGSFASSMTTVSNSGGRRRSVSLRFATDFCAVVCVVCEELKRWMESEEDVLAMPFSHACKIADEAWARAERRKLWILLRRFAGYSDVPIPVSPKPEDASGLQAQVLRAATALLSIGPVSLGSIADAPDNELWSWILEEQVIADEYLRVHFTSLLPSYFTWAFPPVTTTRAKRPSSAGSVGPGASAEMDVLLESIHRAVRFHFGTDSSSGLAPRSVLGERVPRALLLATVLLCPEDWFAREAVMCDFIVTGLVTRVEDCEGFFREVHEMVDMYKRTCDSSEFRANVSKVCAKICPDLSEEMTDLLWDRRAYALSQPWSVKASCASGSLFERALKARVPGHVWKMFVDEQAAMRFLIRSMEVESEDDQQVGSARCSPSFAADLLRHVARKAAFGNIVSVLLPCVDPPSDRVAIGQPPSPAGDRIVVAAFEALLERASELFSYCATEDEDAFIRLAIIGLATSDSFLCGRVRLARELARYMRLVCGMDGDAQARQLVDWVAQQLPYEEEEEHQEREETFVLVSLLRTNEVLVRRMLDEVLVRIARSTGVHRFVLARADTSAATTAAVPEERRKERVPQQQSISDLMRLYKKLRLINVQPRRLFANAHCEESLVLMSCGPPGIGCMQVLCRAVDDLPAFGFEHILRITLEYLVEHWSAGTRSSKDEAEKLAIALFERRLAYSASVPVQVVDRVFWAGMERLLRIALIARMPSLMEMQRTDCFKVLRYLADGDSARSLALNLFKNDALLMSNECSEDALLLLFDVARETESEEWIIAALESKSASVFMASRALNDVLYNSRFSSSTRLAEAAAALVKRTGSIRSSIPTKLLYRGLVEEEEAMESAERAWNEAGIRLFVKYIDASAQVFVASSGSPAQTHQSQQASGSQKRRSFISVRKRTARIAEVGDGNARVSFGANTSGDGSQQLRLSGSNVTSPGLKRAVRKPLLDLRDALADPYARSRLLAHVADRRLDPNLVIALEHYPNVPGIDREDLWQSFQRSRWWLFEDDVSNLFT